MYALERLLADYGTLYLIVLGLMGMGVMLFARRGLWGVIQARTGVDPMPLAHGPPKPRAFPETLNPAPQRS